MDDGLDPHAHDAEPVTDVTNFAQLANANSLKQCYRPSKVPLGRVLNINSAQTGSITAQSSRSPMTESAACSRAPEGSNLDHVRTVLALRQEKPTAREDPPTFHLGGAIRL